MLSSLSRATAGCSGAKWCLQSPRRPRKIWNLQQGCLLLPTLLPCPSLPAPRAKLLETLPQTFPSLLVPSPCVPSPLYLLTGVLGNVTIQFLHPISPCSTEGLPVINEYTAIPDSSASLILLSCFKASLPLPAWPESSVCPSHTCPGAHCCSQDPPGRHPQHPAGCFATRLGAPAGSGSLFGGQSCMARKAKGGGPGQNSRKEGKMGGRRVGGGRGGRWGALPATSVQPPGRSR